MGSRTNWTVIVWPIWRTEKMLVSWTRKIANIRFWVKCKFLIPSCRSEVFSPLLKAIIFRMQTYFCVECGYELSNLNVVTFRPWSRSAFCLRRLREPSPALSCETFFSSWFLSLSVQPKQTREKSLNRKKNPGRIPIIIRSDMEGEERRLMM